MKLSKRDKKQNDIVLELLKKDSLTYEEKTKIFNELNEGVFGDINVGSAFFTGLDLAMDFTLMVPCHGTVLDLCSGFGVLSFSALIRHSNVNYPPTPKAMGWASRVTDSPNDKKISKLKKDIGMDFYMSWSSVDTSVYEQNFKNTTITVECCTLDREI